MATTINALVVGGTGGIGQAIALLLARKFPEACIAIAGRSKTNGDAVCASAPHKNVTFFPLDASRMSNVRDFAQSFSWSSINVLVITAGILTTQGRTVVDPTENLDAKMALHYYGRMLLVRELIEHKKLAEDAVVLSVLDGYRSNVNSKSIVWDDMDLSHGNYSLAKCAEHCTGFTDGMFQHFAATYPSRTFVHALPGFVNTGLAQNSPQLPMKWAFSILARLIATDPDKCAANLLGLSLEETTASSSNGVWGVWKNAAAGSKNWVNMDQNGNILLNKEEASPERLQKLIEHTWAMTK